MQELRIFESWIRIRHHGVKHRGGTLNYSLLLLLVSQDSLLHQRFVLPHVPFSEEISFLELLLQHDLLHLHVLLCIDPLSLLECFQSLPFEHALLELCIHQVSHLLSFHICMSLGLSPLGLHIFKHRLSLMNTLLEIHPLLCVVQHSLSALPAHRHHIHHRFELVRRSHCVRVALPTLIQILHFIMTSGFNLKLRGIIYVIKIEIDSSSKRHLPFRIKTLKKEHLPLEYKICHFLALISELITKLLMRLKKVEIKFKITLFEERILFLGYINYMSNQNRGMRVEAVNISAEGKSFEDTVNNVNNQLRQFRQKKELAEKKIGPKGEGKLASQKEIMIREFRNSGDQKLLISSQTYIPLSEESRHSKDSFDSEMQKKRKEIYAIESFKDQQPDPMNQSTIESNNKLYSMVFLGKESDLDYKESVSTTSSFSKIKELRISDFAIGKRLGAGKFGEVFFSKHKATGFLCAIKRIDKRQMDAKMMIQLVREIKIQSFLSHPNIVKLYAFFNDNNYIYLVEELCYSGQLYLFLKKKKKFPEELARHVIKQVCTALDYMHECEIIHRDLKPENIIYHNGLIKICDFGWSISSKTMRETFCGTPLYVSPELLKKKNYNNKIDVWSVGILTYELLFGRVPFDINSQRDFIKIIEDQIKFVKTTTISNQAKDFILICLKKDPRDRYTVPELLEHPFISHLEQISSSEMF